MRTLVSLCHSVAAALLFSLGLGVAVPAHAAINVGVGCTAGVGDSSSLIDAINLANAEGGGTIALSAGCTYTFTKADNFWYGPDALPPIQSTIVIEGHGATLLASHIGDPTPITANAFRFFYVSGGMESPTGALTLHNLTLRAGYAKGGDSGSGGGGGGAGMGGAIFNQGTLTLNTVSLIDNSAQGGTFNGPDIGGGGIGQDGSSGGNGGGMGGALPGAMSSLSAGGDGSVIDFSGNRASGGGGGGGFLSNANGSNATPASGGQGGGLGGLAGACLGCATTGDGGSGGYTSSDVNGGNGGGFGMGGLIGENYGISGGGGGVGGGGGASGSGGGFGGGGGAFANGGFGGGGGGGVILLTSGGFGGGPGTDDSDGGGGAGMGGAIFNHTGNMRLIDVTLTGNAANGGSIDSLGSGLGAAIFNLNGSIEISFSTIYRNSVSASNGAPITGGPGDGAIYSLAYGNDIHDGSASGAILTIVNSIVYGTTGATHEVVNNSVDGQNANVALLSFGGGNLIDSYQNVSFLDANGTAPLTSNPQLGSLSSSPSAPATLPISAQSPAYNAATSCNDADGNPVTTDARGVARPQYGKCDIGAYEYDGDYIFANGFD